MKNAFDKSGRNATTEQGRRGGSQLAPRPQTSREPLLSQSGATASAQGQIARVKDAGRAPEAGSHLPVQNSAMRNLVGTGAPIQHGSPMSSPTQKSGPQQPTMKGALYTDGAKIGSSGSDAGPVATRVPKRRGKGAAFFGEY